MNRLWIYFLLFISLPALAGPGLPAASPEQVGMSAERLARIAPVMRDYIDQGKLAGISAAVARRGKLVYFEQFGEMDASKDGALEPGAIFRIYSMSKPITSVAVMTLVEQGKLRLNDPVSKFIPAFKNMKVFVRETEDGIETEDAKRDITVRDLLTHTSGLTYGHMNANPVDRMYREKSIMYPRFDGEDGSLADFITELVKVPLLHQPGSAFNYGVSTDVLGRLVEVVSGQPFDDYLAENIFAPLGMDDSGFFVPKEKLARFTANHGTEEGKLVVIDTASGSLFAGKRELLSGGAGMLSTTMDDMRFAQMMLNGGELEGTRILGPKTVELMSSAHVRRADMPADMGVGFGLGFAVVTDITKTGAPGSNGTYYWGGAASTIFWIDPDEDLIVVLMTQFMLSNVYPLKEELAALVYQAVVD